MGKIKNYLLTTVMALAAMCLFFAASPIEARADIASGTSGTCSWVIDDAGTLTIRPTDGVSGTLANNSSNATAFWPWYLKRSSIKSAIIESGVAGNGSCAYMFNGCSKLASLDVSGFDSSKVTNMCSMFQSCYALTSLDVSGFDTSSVMDMDDMFSNCSKITSLDVSRFNTSKVTKMKNMFQNCSKLTLLDVSGFDTSNVTNMRYMFYGCSKLTSLAVAGWNTGNVTDMSYMFRSCSALTSLDVSGFDTSNVTRMDNMFSGCSNLTSLDVSGWDTGEVTNMSSMFNGTSSLSEITLGENFSFKGKNITTSYQAILQTPPSSKDGITYTGKWIREDEIYGPYTPAELRDNYTSAMAGTWVWKEAPTKYTLIFSAGDTGAGGAMPNKKIVATESGTIDPCQFYKFDYHLDHWAVSVNGTPSATTYADGATIPANTYAVGDVITLTPVFAQDEHSFTLNNGEGSFQLNGGTTIEIPDIPAGTSYQIWEETPDGWVLVYQENASGTVEALQSSNALFTNRYQPGTTGVQFSGTKTLDGLAAAEGSFSFKLMEDGEVIQTKSVLDGGFIQFDPIEYDNTMLGTHTYTIREVIDTTQETIDFDRHDEIVTVTVNDNGDGTLNSVVVYDADGIKFANKTRPGILTLEKIGNGAVAGVTDDDEFTFKITFYNEKGVPLDGEDIYYYYEGDSASSVAKAKSVKKMSRAANVLNNAFGGIGINGKSNIATPSNAATPSNSSKIFE